MTRRRWRIKKLFRVVREERVQVSFYVEATSALHARRTPTPDFAARSAAGQTVGEATEQRGARPEGSGTWWWPRDGRQLRDYVPIVR